MKQFSDIPPQQAALVDSLDKPGQINILVLFLTQNDSNYLINQILLSPQTFCLHDGALDSYCSLMPFQEVYSLLSPHTVVVLM